MLEQPERGEVTAVHLVFIALLVLVGGIMVYYFTGTATVYLKNNSQGYSIFYVDGARACNAPAGTQCTVLLRISAPHTLTATTSYGDSNYSTPSVTFSVQRDAEYEYISCGMTGTPGQNCGLFNRKVPPAVY